MAVRFDAAGEHYTSSPLGLTTVPLTVLCWVNIRVDRNTYSTAWCLDDDTTSNVISMQTNDTGTAMWGIYYPDAIGEDAGEYTPGVWYRNAFVTDGSSVIVYHGTDTGSLTNNTGAMTADPSGLATLRIGEDVWGGDWLNGSVANLKIYSAALTQTEIETELASWTAVRTANLVRHHKFQVAETTDYSGNGRTLSGGTGAATDANDPPIGPPPPQPLRPVLVSDRGTVADTTAATTSSVTITSPTTVAIGNYLIARVAVDNSGTNGAAPGCTVADSRSNTWTVLGPALADPGAANAGSTAYLCYARVGTAYQAADTVTFTWGGGSPPAKAVVVEEWTNIHPTAPVAVSAVTNNSGAAGSTTAVSAAITPIGVNQLVYTCLADEGIAGDSITYDADTTNGAWSTLTRLASANATAAANQCVAGQHKAVTAAGAQTWDATITSRDWAAIAVVFAQPLSPAQPKVVNQAALVRASSW